jgi:exodeoxyribonuclease VII small subunit
MDETLEQLPLEKLPFEQALERLEKVVQALEQGEVPLEQAMQLFHEGMKLAHLCGQKLEWAEQQVEVLIKENGEWQKRAFQMEEGAEEG